MTYSVTLPQLNLWQAWRNAARLAISHGIPPDEIIWKGGDDLFGSQPLPTEPGAQAVHVPPHFILAARSLVWHSSPERFSLLYEAVWRLAKGDRASLSQAGPLGRRLGIMAKSVGRDIHKMHAFVRFRELPSNGERRSFGAWFEPEHNTVEPGSDFFVKRFADMDWLIATPALTARFQGGRLTFESGTSKPDLPDDASEALWATYFANIFNPARIKLDAMHSEMPMKYWKNLPETRLIPSMLADAEERVQRMREAGASVPRRGAAAVSTRYREKLVLPDEIPSSLEEAKHAARHCQRCGLCEEATQTVWGEGNREARIVIVGEQPGDCEDLSGRPFVGPAGQLLHGILIEAGLDPTTAWLTNAVKHFKFTPRGRKRIHQNPNRGEIERCRWWLGLELSMVKPVMTMALGASAAFALTGNVSPLAQRRGTIETGLHGGPVLISWHPSFILRERDRTRQTQIRMELTADIRTAMQS